MFLGVFLDIIFFADINKLRKMTEILIIKALIVLSPKVPEFKQMVTHKLTYIYSFLLITYAFCNLK